MDSIHMAEILILLKPDEVRDALWLIDVFERCGMRREEADDWQRRILAQQRFLELQGESGPRH
jgi:hypothetical protein